MVLLGRHHSTPCTGWLKSPGLKRWVGRIAADAVQVEGTVNRYATFQGPASERRSSGAGVRSGWVASGLPASVTSLIIHRPRASAAGQHDRLNPLTEFGGGREDTFFGLSEGVPRALARSAS